MTILLHTIIVLSMFVSTIISGNPNIICSLTMDEKLCQMQEVEKPKHCCSYEREIELERGCKPSPKINSCGISTNAILKTCCKCSTTLPLQSAVLSEVKPIENQIQLTELHANFRSISNRYSYDYSYSYFPNGIHHTISSTILLL